MPLLGPTPQDLDKLQKEATQIVHQKFLLTTAAITVFAVLSSSLIGSQMGAPTSSLGWQAFLAPILLNSTLLALFFASTILSGMLRVITAYLAETKASHWELDWHAYRRLGHIGYTRAYAVVYLYLALASSSYPFVFALIREVELKPKMGLIAHVAISGLTIASIVAQGLLGRPDLEANPEQKWRSLNRDASPR